jgi:NAD(P)H dehydrogenase (quinone)
MEILVLFDSKTGNTYALARAVAEGIEQVEGVKTRMRRVRETTPMEIVRADPKRSEFYDLITKEVPEATIQDLEETEGLAMGCPTRYGNMTPALGNFIESTGALWVRGALVGEPAGVFCSTNTMHGGQEATLLTMMIPLMHLGFIIVPMGYCNPGVMNTHSGGTPYGPSSVEGLHEGKGPDEMELTIARAFGQRLAEITKMLRS